MSSYFRDKFTSKNYDLDNSTAVKKIKLSYIKPNPLNPFETGNLESLKADIAEQGILTPLTVYAKGLNEYILLSGHRRTEACEELQEEGLLDDDYEINAFVVKQPANEDEELDMLVALNGYREVKEENDLVKLVNIYNQRYLDLKVKPKGEKREWIANKLFISGRHVSNLLNPENQKARLSTKSSTPATTSLTTEEEINDLILSTFKKTEKALSKALKQLQGIEKEGFHVDYQPVNRAKSLIGNKIRELESEMSPSDSFKMKM